jgi:seryl-tRNA synthetase
LDDLIAEGLITATGVAGLYGRSGRFEAIVDGLRRRISALPVAAQAEVFHFPPLMSRAVFEDNGYMSSFPHLAGVVATFAGDEREHRALCEDLASGVDWLCRCCSADVVLTPAACYPVYPLVASRGPVPLEGASFDIESFCFRREPSTDPFRLQSFRQKEFVFVGAPEQATARRAAWMAQARDLAADLGLRFSVEPASDAFFGKGGRIAAGRQHEEELKLELLVSIPGRDQPVACMSFNLHQDKFALACGLSGLKGATVHSACAGFGLERLAMALLAMHGADPKAWPAEARRLVG